MNYKYIFWTLLITLVSVLDVIAQDAERRAPGLYPYVSGKTTATIISNAWRVEGDQIIIDYTISNPLNESIIVKPIFKSKTRPNLRFEPKTLTGSTGPGTLNGPTNQIIWQYKNDNPEGFSKDEYFFSFEITSSDSELSAPLGTVLYNVVTNTQSFVVACPKEENAQGILVVKGADIKVKPGQILTGDIIIFEALSSFPYTKDDGTTLRKGHDKYIANSCAPISEYLLGDFYLGDINKNRRGEWGFLVKRKGKYVVISRSAGL